MSLDLIRQRVRAVHQIPVAIISQSDGDLTHAYVEDQCILAALEVYNTDRPILAVTALQFSTSVNYYALTLVDANWTAGLYSIKGIFSPGGADNMAEVDQNEYQILKRPDGTRALWFPQGAPDPTSTSWIYYHKPHTLSDTVDTITSEYPEDIEAFTQLVASFAYRRAASYWALKKSNIMGADTVDQGERVADYNRLAKEAKDYYKEQVTGSGGFPSSGSVDWDITSIRSGRSLLSRDLRDV